MKLFLFVVCSLCCSCISGQFCPSPPDFAMIEDNFASRVGGEVGGTFNLTEIYYNCIAYGGTGGNEFRELTITGRYQVGSAAPALGQASYECRNPGTPTWDNLRVILGIGLAVNETTRGCADCQGMTSNNCTPCHSSCTGLNRCDGPLQHDCCSYLDKNQCVAQCGTNMVANADYSCVCRGLYVGEECMTCNTSLCGERGNARSDCSGCECDSGYTGVYCDSDIDECDIPDWCQNGGTCTNTNGNFTCDCTTNYGGPRCEDLCYGCCDNPCTRGGTCTSDDAGNYSCMCVPGWEGPRCQEFIGGCYNDPCVNGTCHFDLGRGVDFYECMCLVGFTGVNCDTPINYCANNPCKNDGWCTNSQTGPVCECLQGFVGPDCGQPVITCNIETDACGEHGKCINRTTNDDRTAIFCACDHGYIGDFCDISVTDCNMDPCYHRSTCVPTTNANRPFECECVGEWGGHDCSECSLQCGIGRSDAQCTACLCDSDDCNPNLPDDGNDSDVGLIVGCIAAAVLVIVIAVIFALIAFYYVNKSMGEHSTQNPKPQDQLNTRLTAMPRFSGSMLRTSSTFGSRLPSSIPSMHENDETDDDKVLLEF